MSTLDYAPAATGMSRIPRFQPQSRPLPPLETNNDRAGQKPSRLQQLQSNYQQKILREKEEKLINMYEENQKRALQKVQTQGTMRDFFKQRREMEQNGNIQQAPTMANHYKKMRQVGSSPTGGTWSPNSRQHSGSSIHSMGRDRSKPLAPIDRNAQIPQKPQRHGRPKTKDSIVEEKKQHLNGNIKSANAGFNNGSYRSERSPMEETPPPNMANLKSIRNQKINRSGKPPSGKPQQAKMSDFQKFQMEQDQARENRLKAHREAQRQEHSGYEYQTSEDEADENEENNNVDPQEDIARKQKELMERIANQQAELERIRLEREREEIEEKKEMERRRKREEERRKRMKEEEEKRKREEEERRIQEEERRVQEEEEFQRRVAETRANKANSYNTRQPYENEDPYSSRYDDRTYRRDSPAEQYQPTPPPKPKPARVQKRPPPKHSARVERTPSPQFTTNDISMYENAAMDSEAYAGGKIQMAKCSNCGRKFAADRLQRHRNACGNATKKRKVMDPTKMRVAGTEMEQYTGKNRSKTPPKKSNWRAERENFIKALRYAKKCAEVEKTGGDIRNITPPPAAENPSYKQCPYCSRKFNPDAAERHIPRCKNLNTRPAPTRKGRR
ncbi:zinc finger C2HC domain-containing protein 1C-like [Saccostrea cucullata]|uniref:zinc finger C2HC domain-containing protein 1C-like n=1 Tax=Saccostrea cuccullata TaxID=36930 RepID=UPI002ED5F609